MTTNATTTTAAAASKDPARFKYQAEIEAMMFTVGEVRHALAETTQLMESILREQMQELLVRAAGVARRRGSRYLASEDIIFLIRRDRMKMARLTAYLSWRKVRKIANRTGSAGTAAGIGGGGGGGLGNNSATTTTTATTTATMAITSSSSAAQASSAAEMVEEELMEEGGDGDKSKAVKKQKIKLPWNLLDQFEDFDENDSDSDDTDEDEREFYRNSRHRLRKADEVTRLMTHPEYLDYAECRQASFTYKKPTRFRDWLQIEQSTGMRPNNDILDILGFLAHEMVRSLTESSLLVKRDMDKELRTPMVRDAHGNTAVEDDESNTLLERIALKTANKCKAHSLFDCPNERTPLKPLHVQEAYRRLQRNEAPVEIGNESRSRTCFTLRSYSGGSLRLKTRLI